MKHVSCILTNGESYTYPVQKMRYIHLYTYLYHANILLQAWVCSLRLQDPFLWSVRHIVKIISQYKTKSSLPLNDGLFSDSYLVHFARYNTVVNLWIWKFLNFNSNSHLHNGRSIQCNLLLNHNLVLLFLITLNSTSYHQGYNSTIIYIHYQLWKTIYFIQYIDWSSLLLQRMLRTGCRY